MRRAEAWSLMVLDIILLVLATVLMAYLAYALLRPEKF
jgi:K+-transporting ATPase KdpF subunit